MDQTASLIGSKIGSYTVTDVLGQGAMGVVLYAQNEESEAEAAIKLLAPELATDDVSKERMAREAKALLSLKHPNIVSTYEFGSLENGRAYLVLEYVSGENLDDYLLKNKTLPVDITINMAMQIANAMQFAHDAGIIHRDLKPQNIMLNQKKGSLAVKILDFGIAKLTADRRRLTKTGEVVGSPIFMSPEQCQGKKFDNRSDIYSLGIVLFKCLTGRYPHHGSTLRDTFMMKTTKDCPKIEEFCPDYDGPQSLAKLIYKCLEIKPKKRYATMADVYMELRTIADQANIVVDMGQSLKDSGVHFQVKKVSKLEPNKAESLGINFIESRKNNARSGGGSYDLLKLLSVLLFVVVAVGALFAFGYYYLNKANVDISNSQNQPVESSSGNDQVRKKPRSVESNKSSIQSNSDKKPSSFKVINRGQSAQVPIESKTPQRQTKNASGSKPNLKAPKEQVIPVVKPAPVVNPKRGKNYRPSKDEQHDAWWKYRLKKSN